MTQLTLTARRKDAPEEYTPLEANSLCAQVRILSGTGLPEAPLTQEITITAQRAFEGVIRIAMPVVADAPRFYLPGFMYGTNRGEAPLVVDSKCPRLRKNGEFPSSSWWMTRSDRLSHPCALAYGNGRLIGFAASPYFVRQGDQRMPWLPGLQGDFDQYTGFGCSLRPEEIWYTLGYENAPWFFLDSHHYCSRTPLDTNCFALAQDESIVVHLYCFDFAAEDERTLHDALKWIYLQYHESPRRLSGVRKTVEDIATAIARDAWLPKHHMYSGFVFDRGDHFTYNPLPSISWTNGLSAAVPMLASSIQLKDEAMRLQALDCIDHIVKYSVNEQNDLPYLVEENGQWSNRGWWYDRQPTPGHAAYLVGQSVYLVLKAYEWEKRESGVIHDNWLAFAKRVVARTEQSRNADGEYPYILSEKTGAGLEYDSFSGAWCMAAAAYYSFLTGDRAYINPLLCSEQWYHDTYVRHQECYGGPLDIDKNIDSEGILAYIRGVRYLHEITGEPDLLEHLRDALYYEYTFKFCYNSPIKVPPLSRTGWSSCGGSITSVVNPHIHPMSSSVMDEMAYFLSKQEDTYIRSRLEDTLLWSCQCHNTFDREYDYGKKGWMSERFCHSEGLLTERYPDGAPASTWFALMPWACGALLEGLTGALWSKGDYDK